MTMIVFLALNAEAQGDWRSVGNYNNGSSNSSSSSSSELKPVGGFVSGGVNDIYRNVDQLPALGEGYFDAGLMFGKKTFFVIRLGAYTQSDFFVEKGPNAVGGNSFSDYYQYNYYYGNCNCYDQGYYYNQNADKRFQYLKVGHFQIGIGSQGETYGVRATAGLAGFDYQIPVVDSVGNEVPLEIARGTAMAIGFTGKFKLKKNLLSINLLTFTDVNRMSMAGTVGKAEIDYLVGFGEGEWDGKVYLGPGLSVKQHVVSGREYSARVILEAGHDKFFLYGRIFGGIVYNPLPTEGVGWELGFQIGFDRFAKAIFHQ